MEVRVGKRTFLKLWKSFVICVLPASHLQVELVNIGAADIVDGNHKLILGLIWSIILHWQVCVSVCSYVYILPWICQHLKTLLH